MYSNAFCGEDGKLCPQDFTIEDGFLATLETEGNWLIIADPASGSKSPNDLASMLDQLLEKISSAPEVKGIPVTLTPASPRAQADQLRSVPDWSSGCDLRLMSPVNDVSSIPTAAKSLIIVAAVRNDLHFRIFGGDGRMVVDTDERELTTPAGQYKDLRKHLEGLINELKKHLKSLWPPHEPTKSEKDRVIAAVTSVLGPTKRAALMTLYLGKIGLMLRNAIEHGSDRVKGDSLEIDCSGYWNEKRGKKRVRKWIKDKAKDRNVDWRSKGSIPPDEPLAAKGLVLTSESLKRCMVLISLVLKGCKSHLKIPYPKVSG